MPEIRQQVSLQALNTLGLPATAKYFCSIDSETQLVEALGFAAGNNCPVMMLGGGSNIVLATDFDGLVIHNQLRGVQFDEQHGGGVIATVASGENWHQLAMRCIEQGYYGLQNLVLIPGSVGAAPIQNIGAYGVELISVFHSLRGWDVQAGEFREMTLPDCQFGYRDSIFKHTLKDRFYITEVRLRLSKDSRVDTDYRALRHQLFELGMEDPTPAQVAEAVIKLRSSKLPDPAQLANAGSFFKNPVVSAKQCQALLKHYPALVHYPQDNGEEKLAAGWLVEKAGWKGKRVGEVGMHSEQSIVMINYGAGEGDAVLALAEDIQRDIDEKFGVQLEIEPRVY